MAKHNNANWDHYKVAGREHPGDDVHHEEERKQFSAKAHPERIGAAGPHIPNQERTSKPPADQADENASEAGRLGSAYPQNISGTEEVEPTLSDDEGHTG